MSVEIKKSKASTSGASLEEILYQYPVKDELKFTHDQFYSFPREAQSLIEYQSKLYRAKTIHLTPPLHKATKQKHFGEILVEHEYIEESTGKSETLWVCFFMIKGQSGLDFPLKTNSLEQCMNQCKMSALLYKSRNGFPVLICTQPVQVGPTVPTTMKGNAKSLYKELLEPDVFDVLSSIVTLQDSQIATQVDAVPVRVSKKLFSPLTAPSSTGVSTTDTIQEGFYADDTYMECELLQEDGTEPIGAYTVTPLNQNATADWYSAVVYIFQGFLFACIFGIVMPLGLKECTSKWFSYGINALFYLSVIFGIIWVVMALTKCQGPETLAMQVTASILFGIWFFHLLGYYALHGMEKLKKIVTDSPYLINYYPINTDS